MGLPVPSVISPRVFFVLFLRLFLKSVRRVDDAPVEFFEGLQKFQPVLLFHVFDHVEKKNRRPSRNIRDGFQCGFPDDAEAVFLKNVGVFPMRLDADRVFMKDAWPDSRPNVVDRPTVTNFPGYETRKAVG